MPLNANEPLVTLDRQGRAPLRVRLAAALRDAIRNGQLPPGTTLPSTRVLAQNLGFSRGVVVDAYGQLAAEGFLRSHPGAGTTVVYAPPASLPAGWQDERPSWHLRDTCIASPATRLGEPRQGCGLRPAGCGACR